jgi:RNA recognition motif-containing protein
MTVFQQFGTLTTMRLVRHGVTKQSLGYGFVRFQTVSDAQLAIQSLDGVTILGHTLQIKPADSDAGPPTTNSASGLTPSDSVYIKHLPPSHSAQEIIMLFETFGPVVDVKLFPCLDQFRGGSALVKMISIEAAEAAINGLNGKLPPGSAQALIVRFAESTAEKAARMSRRDQQQQQHNQRGGTNNNNLAAVAAMLSGGGTPSDLSRSRMSSMVTAGSGNASLARQIQQALAALSVQASNNDNINGNDIHNHHQQQEGNLPPPSSSLDNFQQHQAVAAGAAAAAAFNKPCSICIKGLLPEIDKLWIYENFAHHGALLSMNILTDRDTGKCTGTAYVKFGDAIAAEKAIVSMHGTPVMEDQMLHVTMQNIVSDQSGLTTTGNGTGGEGSNGSDNDAPSSPSTITKGDTEADHSIRIE